MDCCRDPLDQVFDARTARRDLSRFRKNGPDRPTQALLTGIQASLPAGGATLLDIGGGIGAIHHILLERGFSSAVHVDYARPLLERSGLTRCWSGGTFVWAAEVFRQRDS